MRWRRAGALSPPAGAVARGRRAEVRVGLRSVPAVPALQPIGTGLFSLLSPLSAGGVHKNCCLFG